MAKVKEVTYERIFPLREKFSNERLSVTLVLGPGETVAKAFKDAKQIVAKASTRYREMVDRERDWELPED